MEWGRVEERRERALGLGRTSPIGYVEQGIQPSTVGLFTDAVGTERILGFGQILEISTSNAIM